MCLYIGSKSKFVAEHDIIVYKELSDEISKGVWVTPTRRWPIEFNKVLIPEDAVREWSINMISNEFSFRNLDTKEVKRCNLPQ